MEWLRLCFFELKRALLRARDASENDEPALTVEAVTRVVSDPVACGLRE